MSLVWFLCLWLLGYGSAVAQRLAIWLDIDPSPTGDSAASSQTDNEAARMMQEAKDKLFRKVLREGT